MPINSHTSAPPKRKYCISGIFTPCLVNHWAYWAPHQENKYLSKSNKDLLFLHLQLIRHQGADLRSHLVTYYRRVFIMYTTVKAGAFGL